MPPTKPYLNLSKLLDLIIVLTKVLKRWNSYGFVLLFGTTCAIVSHIV